MVHAFTDLVGGCATSEYKYHPPSQAPLLASDDPKKVVTYALVH